MVRFFKNSNYDFMGGRKKAAAISMTVIGISVLVMIANLFIPGRGSILNWGIDFLGGTQIQLEMPKDSNKEAIAKAMDSLGYKDFDVVKFGSAKRYYIRMRSFSSLADDKKIAIENAFKAKYTTNFFRVRFSESGDSVKVRFFKPVDLKEFKPILDQLGINHKLPKVRLSQEAIEYKAKVKRNEKAVWEKDHSADLDFAEVTGVSPMKNEYTITLNSISEKLQTELNGKFGFKLDNNAEGGVKVLSVESRGPQVGRRLRVNGILSLLYAIGFILLYIVIRFDLKFAPGAVVALVHDVMITVGIFAALYIEFSLPILAALLTIIGYSLNDTIVIYDRIRENIIKLRSRDLAKVINTSLNETLSRTVLTSLTTLFSVLAIAIMTTGVLREFAVAMVIGVLIGTYSSIYVASPMVLWFNATFEEIAERLSSRPREEQPEDYLDDEDDDEGSSESSEDKKNPERELSEEEQKKQAIRKAKRAMRKTKGGRGGRR
ncbi:protein translocase subunit SecF [Myxococcota bacterium]|nr:protein translocase subunit SecF [Myxococcota bacterium]MBU1380063.1 protein translocase subunit SecF [Myxococcota bacterium]MBU1495521.1 protein translocase subunit SecF [Myxococcota bacterium]